MPLPNTNISIGLVANELGVATTSVGQLCTSATINKWSKYKPYFLNDISASKLNGVAPYPTGFYVKQDSTSIPTKTVYYLDVIRWVDVKPWIEHGWFKLGDFRGYDHNAEPAGIDSSRVLIQATPGLNVNVRIVQEFKGCEFARNMILFDEMLNAIQPTSLIIGYNNYTASELNGLFGDKIYSEINSSDIMWEAPYLFESIVNFRIQDTTPYFLDAYSNKIYFSLQDAINAENNMIEQVTVSPQLEIPTYFNNIYKDGTNYYKNGLIFRDCPIRPKVYFNGILTTNEDFFFRNISMQAVEAGMGLPEHYAIFGDFYNNYATGEYFVTVTLKLHNVDWSVKNVINPEIETTYEFEYGYNSNPSDGTIPAFPLQADNFFMDLNGYSSQNFSFILNQIPFRNYSSYYGNNQLGWERVNQQGVELILNFYSA